MPRAAKTHEGWPYDLRRCLSAADRIRYPPVGISPSRKPPMAILASPRTDTPTAASIRRICRFRPS